MPIQPEDFLKEDYVPKVSYLAAHFTRMWARFKYFVAIETALVSGKFLFPAEMPKRVLSIIGVLVSAVWYVMGLEDRYLVCLYRHQVRRVVRQLVNFVWSDEEMQTAYRYVGQVDEVARADLRLAVGTGQHNYACNAISVIGPDPMVDRSHDNLVISRIIPLGVCKE